MADEHIVVAMASEAWVCRSPPPHQQQHGYQETCDASRVGCPDTDLLKLAWERDMGRYDVLRRHAKWHADLLP